VVGITGAVQRVLLALDAQREAGGLARVDLVYNARQSGANAVRVQVVLPLDPAVLQAAAGRAWPTRVLPAYRMPRSALFSALVREYLFVSLFRACAQSLAGEHASRLAAMQLAERHVDARLDELREAHRQARQEAITSELLDVVAGFEVLAGPGSL
jgi:F-type H+-transporting ATPase subunit gamma